jgi:hypothetical protein
MRVSIVCSSSRPSIRNPESAGRKTYLPSTRREEEPALGASYWRGEQRLIATALAWTILRMNYYAEALVQQPQASLDRG